MSDYQRADRKENVIVILTFEFAKKIIRYCDELELRKRFVIARQLLKAGTSIGANVWEAQNAESRADFIHRMKIAAKEADETEFWLLLCRESAGYPGCEEILLDCSAIIKVLSKIISTSRK